jgi:hypothetical protein
MALTDIHQSSRQDAEGSPHFERNAYLDDLHNSIVSGFQLATAAGTALN